MASTIGDKAVARAERASELDLLAGYRAPNPNAPVLNESLQQLNALLQHAVPGVVAGVGQTHVLARGPLLEQHSRWVFMAEEGSHGLFEGTTKEHGGARVFLLPAVEIAMAITARAGRYWEIWV